MCGDAVRSDADAGQQRLLLLRDALQTLLPERLLLLLAEGLLALLLLAEGLLTLELLELVELAARGVNHWGHPASGLDHHVRPRLRVQLALHLNAGECLLIHAQLLNHGADSH
ncbi:MAG: hypothetical protein JO362_01480 [Streptomycetaceae bacterium]|nr:hypothetical protein [Streptomycetaceae bacterium]